MKSEEGNLLADKIPTKTEIISTKKSFSSHLQHDSTIDLPRSDSPRSGRGELQVQLSNIINRDCLQHQSTVNLFRMLFQKPFPQQRTTYPHLSSFRRFRNYPPPLLPLSPSLSRGSTSICRNWGGGGQVRGFRTKCADWVGDGFRSSA